MPYNPQAVVPILGQDGSVKGIWARNPEFSVTRLSLAELYAHADNILFALTHPKVTLRRVPNSHFTIRGNNQFPGGVFIMINDALSPTEEVARGLTEYHLLNMGGGISFLNALTAHSQKFHPDAGLQANIKAPAAPTQTSKPTAPPPAGKETGKLAEQPISAGIHKSQKKWWEFWK